MNPLGAHKSIVEVGSLSLLDTYRVALIATEGNAWTVLQQSEWARQYTITTVDWQSLIVEDQKASGYSHFFGEAGWYDAYYSVSQALVVNYEFVDETKRENPKKPVIKPKEEKKLSSFASFFVKLKQLKLDVLRSLQHAKKRLHLGEKFDLSFLLKQNLRSVTLESRKVFVNNTEKNQDRANHFYDKRFNSLCELKNSRRVTKCEVGLKTLEKISIAENAKLYRQIIRSPV